MLRATDLNFLARITSYSIYASHSQAPIQSNCEKGLDQEK